jgi:hypothetical protein
MSLFRYLLTLVVTILLAGCGTGLQYTELTNETYTQRKSPNEVDILFDEPDQEYERLGRINWDYYEAGMSPPDLNDVSPDLRKKASQEGGDALIIREQQASPGANSRVFRVIAEVIRYSEPSH